MQLHTQSLISLSIHPTCIIIFIVPICYLTEINDSELLQVAKYELEIGKVGLEVLEERNGVYIIIIL